MKISRFLISQWWLLYGLALAAISFYVAMGLWGEPSADADPIFVMF